MAEAEATGHVGASDEVEPQERVDCVHHGGLGDLCRGRCQLELEGIARDCRSFQHEAARAREYRELLGDRRGNGRRNIEVGRRRLFVNGGRTFRAIEGPGELLEIEGVAAALLVQESGVRAFNRTAQQLLGFLVAEGAELDPVQRLRTVRLLERSREPLRHLARTDGECEYHRPRRRAAQQRSDELDRRRVGPVEVVEHENHRL